MFDELFPTLKEAAKHILYDNGVVNSATTEQKELDRVRNAWRQHCTIAELGLAEFELSAMSPEQLLETCCGEAGGEQSVSTECDKVLNLAFEVPA